MFNGKFPEMDKAHKKLIDMMILSVYDYILEAGDDELLAEIKASGKDLSCFPSISSRMLQWEKRN